MGCWWNLPGKTGAVAVVRGLRAISDFEFEFQMALMNRKLEPADRNGLPDAAGGVHLSFLANRQGDRAAGGAGGCVCAGAGGRGAAKKKLRIAGDGHTGSSPGGFLK